MPLDSRLAVPVCTVTRCERCGGDLVDGVHRDSKQPDCGWSAEDYALTWRQEKK